jgi:hypothetical protein
MPEGDILAEGANGAITPVEPDTAGYVLTDNGPGNLPTYQPVGASVGGNKTLTFIFSGNGSVPSTGQYGFVIRPATGGTIVRASIFGDVSGSAVVDIKKSTYANFPTVSSITASAKPTLSSAQKNEDSTLTGWTTSFAARDCFVGVLDSVSTITVVTVIIEYTPT